jgi:hypothetical protein
MKRIVLLLISVIAGIILTATSALADSPHFLFADNSISTSTGALTTSFKDAGLGTGTTSVTITLTVNSATAVYQCFNNGGNHPKAGNKETVSTSLSTTGTFPVRNGQTTASLTVGPPSQGSFTCPSGQSLFLQSATYTGTSVSDQSPGNTLGATPDPISTGPIHVLIS